MKAAGTSPRPPQLLTQSGVGTQGSGLLEDLVGRFPTLAGCEHTTPGEPHARAGPAPGVAVALAQRFRLVDHLEPSLRLPTQGQRERRLPQHPHLFRAVSICRAAVSASLQLLQGGVDAVLPPTQRAFDTQRPRPTAGRVLAVLERGGHRGQPFLDPPQLRVDLGQQRGRALPPRRRCWPLPCPSRTAGTSGPGERRRLPRFERQRQPTGVQIWSGPRSTVSGACSPRRRARPVARVPPPLEPDRPAPGLGPGRTPGHISGPGRPGRRSRRRPPLGQPGVREAVEHPPGDGLLGPGDGWLGPTPVDEAPWSSAVSIQGPPGES